MFDDKVILETAILTANRSLPTSELLVMFDGRIEEQQLLQMLEEIGQFWCSRGLELKQLQNGWRFQSKTQLSEYLQRLNPEKPPKYSRAVLETLAIIAYRQPVTRSDIEQIRGVAENPNVIRQLQERDWIDVVGQREVPGRPSLYATTKHFLDDLNLRSLAELPPFEAFAQSEIPLE